MCAHVHARVRVITHHFLLAIPMVRFDIQGLDRLFHYLQQARALTPHQPFIAPLHRVHCRANERESERARKKKKLAIVENSRPLE